MHMALDVVAGTGSEEQYGWSAVWRKCSMGGKQYGGNDGAVGGLRFMSLSICRQRSIESELRVGSGGAGG